MCFADGTESSNLACCGTWNRIPTFTSMFSYWCLLCCSWVSLDPQLLQFWLSGYARVWQSSGYWTHSSISSPVDSFVDRRAALSGHRARAQANLRARKDVSTNFEDSLSHVAWAGNPSVRMFMARSGDGDGELSIRLIVPVCVTAMNTCCPPFVDVPISHYDTA